MGQKRTRSRFRILSTANMFWKLFPTNKTILKLTFRKFINDENKKK
jgi:hypothetical protein